MPKSSKIPHILIIAGETSGDRLGAHLVQAMTAQDPTLTFTGFGGDLMQAAGVDILMHSQELAIIGLVEVIKKQATVRRAFKIIKHQLKHNPPDLVILIDYPGFNLRIARLAKQADIKVFYYASPQIWAWKYGRINTIRDTVDHMAVLFPFEEKLYHQEQVPATFVGHPLTAIAKPSMNKEDAYVHFNCDPAHPVIGLFPGSRPQEITTLLPIMAKAIPIVEKTLPDAQWLLPVAPHIDTDQLRQQLPDHIQLIHSHLYDAMQICDAAMAVSGTITLELALLQTPLTLLYKTQWLTYQIGKRVIRTPWIGLCNIIAQNTIATEYLQHDASPENLASEIVQLITNISYREKRISQLQAMRNNLGTGVDHTLTAQLALDLLPGQNTSD